MNAGFAQQKDDFSRICSKLSKMNIVRGEFDLEQYSKKADRKVVSSGDYTISAEDGIIWFTKKPVKSVMAVTKEFMVQEMNGKQRKIDGSKNPTFSNMANVISSLFTGKYEEINRDFTVECKYIETTNFGWSIKLTPKDSTIASYIKEINITVDELYEDCQIFEIKMEMFNGDSSTYRLKNQVLTDNLTSDEAKYFEK